MILLLPSPDLLTSIVAVLDWHLNVTLEIDG